MAVFYGFREIEKSEKTNIHSSFCKKHATAFVFSLKKLQGVTKTFVPHFRTVIHIKLNYQSLKVPCNFLSNSTLRPNTEQEHHIALMGHL